MKEGKGREKEKKKKKKKKDKKTRTRTITTRRPRTPNIAKKKESKEGQGERKGTPKRIFEDKAFGREKGQKSPQIAGKMACWGLSEAKQPPPFEAVLAI